MKMILGNKVEFNIESVIDIGNDTIEIRFENGYTYNEVAVHYDSYLESDAYSVEALRKIELYAGENNDELQGTHYGYTITKNISCFEGNVVVQIQKENEMKTEIENLKEQIAQMQVALASAIKA